jgi:hypothetical protein
MMVDHKSVKNTALLSFVPQRINKNKTFFPPFGDFK